MPALNSTQVWSITPLIGIDLGAKSSTPGFDLLTLLQGSDGRSHIYIKASEALGSIETIKIGASGSASSDSGSSGWSGNYPGGLTTGQYGWARRTSI